MRMSRMLFETRRRVAQDGDLPSQQLVLRAGLARQVASGIYALTPIAVRTLRRLETIVRSEMDAVGAQEVLLPVVHPRELWEASGRFSSVDDTLVRFQDRTGHGMVLAMTHEEAATDLVKAFVHSARQLPQLIFQIQTKFRDELRPRGGLVRLREFLMKDAYSFHPSPDDLDAHYQEMLKAYQRIFVRTGVPVVTVASDTGFMGGTTAHEFMLLAPGGEDTLVLCRSCGYAANREVAVSTPPVRREPAGGPDTPQEVDTPGADSIGTLSQRYGWAADRMLKTVYRLTASGRIVVALVRGDREVNEVKLSRALSEPLLPLGPARAAELGLTPGFVGPGPGLPRGVLVAADTAVDGGPWVTGANRPDAHRVGMRLGRDFRADISADIGLVQSGDTCLRCGAPLEFARGIEVGNIFKLDTVYSEKMGLVLTAPGGASFFPWMGCYGLGITRLLAAVVEAHHDERGIVWPPAVAPWPVHLLTTHADPNVQEAADQVYGRLGQEAALYDDRLLSAGVKFQDADLLGMPVRITVSPRSLAQGGVELCRRRTGERRVVSLDEAAAAALAWAAEGSPL